MFVDNLSASPSGRLTQILNALQHVHNVTLPTKDVSQLHEMMVSCETNLSNIIKNSAFNSYHQDPSYVRLSLICEAVRLLTETSSQALKRRAHQTQIKESAVTKKTRSHVTERRHAKPDFLDVDGDGDRKEPMKKALADKAKKNNKASKVDEAHGVHTFEVTFVDDHSNDSQTTTVKANHINQARRVFLDDNPGTYIEKIAKAVSESLTLREDANLDQAETLLAAKSLSDQLQDMAEDAAKMSVDKLMPLVDTMKSQFGQPAADGFNQVVKSQLQIVLDAIISAKDQTDNAINTLQGGGTPTSGDDISAPMPDDQTDLPFPDEGSEEGDINFDQQFDATPSSSGPITEPLGRSKKEVSEGKYAKRKNVKEVVNKDQNPAVDLAMMAASGKDARNRPLTPQQKKAAGDAAKILGGVNEAKKDTTNPYAVGMAQAMEITGDKPPLKKSTIKLAHKIAGKVEKQVKENQLSSLRSTVTEMRNRFKVLEGDLDQHKRSYKRMISEGKVTDVMGTGIGLEGDAILEQMKTVSDHIRTAVEEFREIKQQLAEQAQFEAQTAERVQQLDHQLSTQPYGVTGTTHQNQRFKKFFESQQHRHTWLDYNRSTIKESKLINPDDVRQVQAKLKRSI
jgi:hypothetical protein